MYSIEKAIEELKENGYAIPPDALEIVKTMKGITRIFYSKDNASLFYQSDKFGESVTIYKDGQHSQSAWLGML